MDDLTRVPDQLIEETLAQRSFAPLPPGFVDRVMAHILAAHIQSAQVQVTREVIRYKLELLDIALPILGACLFVLVMGLTGQLAFLGIATPITWSAVLPPAILPPLTDWLSSNWLDLVGLLVFAEICVGALFCMWFWLDRPLPLLNGEG